eukprot:CCRYP_005254-RA/>CCRYP_005254-RA protein AED:0.00 eAED:0.00 QI:1328/1/1/1/1/1/2/88/859
MRGVLVSIIWRPSHLFFMQYSCRTHAFNSAAIYFWMENEKEGDTCHKEALKHNFGGTLNVINGGLECPAYAGGWHHKAVKLRINRYCHAASLLSLSELGAMSGCKGMDDSLDECLNDGSCPFCEQYGDGNYTKARNESDAILKSDVAESYAGSNETTVPDSDDSFGNETAAVELMPTNMPSILLENELSNSPTAVVMDNDALALPAVALVSIPPTAGGTASVTASLTNATSASLTSAVPTTSTNVTSSSSSPTAAVTTRSSLISSMPTTSSNSTSSSSSIAGIESSSRAPTASASFADATLSSSPTAVASENFSNVTSESLIESPSPSSVARLETAAPSPALSTAEKSSDPTWSPTIVETVGPSFSPTTPAPTLGPCDGEPCPDMLCRSPWGFCGEGDGYCNDDAKWSPDCIDNSPSPTQATSSSDTQLATFDVNGFDTYDPQPFDPKNSDPTKSPTLSASVPKFEKPSGGKKPPPNKKPGLSSSEGSNGKGEAVISETPLPTSAPIPMPTEVPVSAAPTQKPVLSPDDPAATYFCGEDWIDANKVCAIRCPSAKSEDCPGDQSCFAFTRCNENPPTLAPIDTITPQPFDNMEEYDNATMSNVTSRIPTSPDGTSSSPSVPEMASPSPKPVGDIESLSGCTGKPCEVSGECRSQFGFCGSTFIYCNDLSSWTLDNCGLFGTDQNGGTVLCDADTNECPGGDRMIRNPDNNCEFFPCPVEEETGGTQFAFNAPASTPTLPELPKPTLPTITDPKKPDFNSLDFSFGSGESNQTINLGMAKPAKDPSKVVVIGNEDHVADDKPEAPEATNSSSFSEKGVNDLFSFNNYNDFTYEDWINCGRYINLHWLLSLFMVLIAFLSF